MKTTWTVFTDVGAAVKVHVSPFDHARSVHPTATRAVSLFAGEKASQRDAPSGARAPAADVHPVPGVRDVAARSREGDCAIVARAPWLSDHVPLREQTPEGVRRWGAGRIGDAPRAVVMRRALLRAVSGEVILRGVNGAAAARDRVKKTIVQ